MIINITGGSKSQKKYAESIVNFCAKKLMPKMRSGLEINIFLKDFGKDDNLGYAVPADDADGFRPRSFDIEINKKYKLRTVLCTICHEMVHVKQFARGELYESTRLGKHRWQGEWIDKDPDYWDRPWEIEAHGRETGLYLRWVKQEALNKKKWTKFDD